MTQQNDKVEIQITREIRENIKRLRLCDRESHFSVINRLIKFWEEKHNEQRQDILYA
ncbi:MAG: hypothetical protein AABX85_00910 [Nanoarchaeota archaeon]